MSTRTVPPSPEVAEEILWQPWHVAEREEMGTYDYAIMTEDDTIVLEVKCPLIAEHITKMHNTKISQMLMVYGHSPLNLALLQ